MQLQINQWAQEEGLQEGEIMIRDITEKPTNPKNGDRFQAKDGIVRVFRYGRWVEENPVDE